VEKAISGLLISALTGLAGAGALAGCSHREPPDRLERVRTDIPPRPYEPPMRDREEIKPLPEAREYGGEVPPPPYDDVPLVNQRPPEQRAYVNAYEAVGRPRIAVFVNRTLEGELVPVNPEGPLVTVERRRTSRGDVSVESRDYRDRGGYYGRDGRESVDRFETRGPGEYRDTTAVYLRPGEYDEVSASSIDYETLENILTDWLAADGRVEVVSPVMARQRLNDQQVKELQEGRPQALSEIARQLDTDVLVQVQAHPTVQTRRGLQVRVIAEAINVRGGQSVARAVVEVPPPLDKPQLNKYTRFLARRLMDGMSNSWRAMVSDPGRQRELDRDARRSRDRDGNRDRDTQPPATPDGVMRPADERRELAPATHDGPRATARPPVPTTRPSDAREPEDRPQPSEQPPVNDSNK
jgi:hypothetical protein